MTSVEKIQQMLTAAEQRVETLKQMLAQAKEEEAKSTAYENAYDAVFDGLKYIADPENPFTLVFPMMVKANMYYAYNDGIKDIRYICIKDGMVTTDTISEFLTPDTIGTEGAE